MDQEGYGGDGKTVNTSRMDLQEIYVNMKYWIESDK